MSDDETLHDAQRAGYQAARRRQADALLGASMRTETIETTAEMVVDPPLNLHLAAMDSVVQITRVKVSAIRPAWPRAEVDDRPYASLWVHAHELNTKGEPHGQRSPVWLPITDEELAETLLGRGLVS